MKTATTSFNPAAIASAHAGRELSQGCGPWLIEKNGQRSEYIYDWNNIEILSESISDEGVEEGEMLQQLQLTSPSGEVLHAGEKRLIRYRRGHSISGDYEVVVPL